MIGRILLAGVLCVAASLVFAGLYMAGLDVPWWLICALGGGGLVVLVGAVAVGWAASPHPKQDQRAGP